MNKIVSFIILVVCLAVAYKIGLINTMINYINASITKAQQEEVYHNPDGSVTTVRYRSLFGPR
ncbi:hypothetical protein IJ182_05340 [bacterium]|nr:hypothetical protein [bacterium]